MTTPTAEPPEVPEEGYKVLPENYFYSEPESDEEPNSSDSTASAGMDCYRRGWIIE